MNTRRFCVVAWLAFSCCLGSSVVADSVEKPIAPETYSIHGGAGDQLTAAEVAQAESLWYQNAGAPRGVGVCTSVGYSATGVSASISTINSAGGDSSASTWDDVEIAGPQRAICEIDMNLATDAGAAAPYTATVEVWDAFPTGDPCDLGTANMLGTASVVVNATGPQLVTFVFATPVTLPDFRPNDPPPCAAANGAQFGNADCWIRFLSTETGAGPVLNAPAVVPTVGCSDGVMGFCGTGQDGLFGGFFALEDGRFSMEIRVTDAPPGACCNLLGASDCTDGVDLATCTNAGGIFLGSSSTCAASSCEGACCIGTSCQNTSLRDCETFAGLFNGIGSDCNVIDPCTPQACCDGGGFCQDQPQANCNGAWFPGEFCSAGHVCPSSDIFGTIDVGCNNSLQTDNSALLDPGDAGYINNPSYSTCSPAVADAGGEFWVSFVATANSARVSTENSVVEDTIIQVFTGPDPFSLTAVQGGCIDDNNPGVDLRSTVCISTNIGDTYWVLAASFDNNPPDKGPFTVDIECPCPAVCESCPGDVNNDTILDGGDVQQFTRCLTGAEIDPLLCLCADMDDDGDADVDDIPPFVAAVLGGGFCPGFPAQSCPIGSLGQLPEITNAVASNSNALSGRYADNFDTPGGTLTEITWWGSYFGAGCPDSGDDFTITIHNDDNNGFPGSVVTTLTGQTPAKVLTGRLNLGDDEYQYTLSGLNVNLAAGCYWLHIGNADTAGGCIWFWLTSDDGDAIATADPNGSGYQRLEGTNPVVDDIDVSWCLDITLGDNSTCLIPVGACCTADGLCLSTTTETDCFVGLSGSQWFVNEDCGAGFQCPLPPDDNCIDPQPVFDGTTSVNLGLATDSGLLACGDFPFGNDQVNADVFFAYEATCTGELFVDTCASDGAEVDTRLAMYDVDCTAIVGGTLPIECNDDHGNAVEADTGNTCAYVFSAAMSVPVTAGNTYIIRVGTFGAAPVTDIIELNITCAVDGACCTGTSCTDVTGGATECSGLGGVFLGAGTSCATAVCGGACCLPNATCTQAGSASDCLDNLGGTFYYGDGSQCTDPLLICPEPGECLHSITLFDNFGDGWNNGGPSNLIEIFADGVSVFGGAITLDDGVEGTFNFSVAPGAVITTTYTAADGFEEENSWELRDGNGDLLCQDLGGPSGPVQTPMRACGTAVCP